MLNQFNLVALFLTLAFAFASCATGVERVNTPVSTDLYCAPVMYPSLFGNHTVMNCADVGTWKRYFDSMRESQQQHEEPKPDATYQPLKF